MENELTLIRMFESASSLTRGWLDRRSSHNYLLCSDVVVPNMGVRETEVGYDTEQANTKANRRCNNRG